MEVHFLGSGSDGNATLIVSRDTAILFDAGLGPRQLKQRLQRIGMTTSDIQACFLTHEHIDHVAGLKRISFPTPLLFANAPTWQATSWQHPETRRHAWQEMPPGSVCNIGDLYIESFATSHDAAFSVGYLVYQGKETLVYATDLGEVSSELYQAVAAADYLVLESNHDRQMLQNGPYPWYLKQRVASAYGHLSNAQTAELLASRLTPRTRWVVLAHLSRTNNTPQIALETVGAAIAGLSLHRDFYLCAAPALATGEMLSLK